MLFFTFAGGGAVEAALSVYLESFATTLGSREQMAIAEFADALLVRVLGAWGARGCPYGAGLYLVTFACKVHLLR